MSAAADPDYCAHGRSMAEACFFCRRGNFSGSFTGPTVPEHRNPPAAAVRTHFELHTRGASKRGAAATHKTAKPAEPVNGATVAKRKGGITTARRRVARKAAPAPPHPAPTPPPAVAPIPPVVALPRRPDPTLLRALRRLKNLEREVDRMKAMIARTIGEIAASAKGAL